MFFDLLWRSSMIAAGITILRLLLIGLWRSYLALCTYLVLALACNLLLLGARSAHAYASIWMVADPLTWLFLGWVVIELYVRLTRSYPGIGAFGIWLILTALSASVAISILIGRYDYPEWAGTLAAFLAVRRGIAAALALFLIFVYWFFSRYREPICLNVWRHLQITTILCGGYALQALTLNLTGRAVIPELQTVAVGIIFVSYGSWGLLLTVAGEAEPVKPVLSDERLAAIDHRATALLTWLRLTGKG